MSGPSEPRDGAEELQMAEERIRSIQLLEANEALTVAALRADEIAEAAVSRLDRVIQSSQRDELTGTPNRALMLDRVERALVAARRQGTQLAVLFLDLDHFKRINDRWGHACGDRVLQWTAGTLVSTLRASDSVSRQGGDEFVVLLSEVSSRADADRVAAKIEVALEAPLRLEGHELQVTASIGIATYPQDAMDAKSLIEFADAAMYRTRNVRASGSLDGLPRRVAPVVSAAPSQRNASSSPMEHRRSKGGDAQARVRDLVEANEHLVLTALAAQEASTEATAAHVQQVESMARVAHELRSPLNPLLIAVELLCLPGLDPAKVPEMRGIIERQMVHLQRLIDDLLDGARASGGRLHVQEIRISMTALLQQVSLDYRPVLSAKRQQLIVRIPAGPLTLQGDPVRLAQVFRNLLDNASKFSPEGGVVELTAEERGDSQVITVTDHGIGLSGEDLASAFQLFWQSPAASALSPGGLGVGLSLARSIVEAHSGSLVAKSAGKGQGSQFVVSLPMEDLARSE